MSRTSGRLTACLFIFTVMVLAVLSLKPLSEYESAADLGTVNGEWARELETHYDEHFPARDLGTNLWAAIDYALFNEGREGVVVGTDGWLFSSEEFYPASSEPDLVASNLERVRAITRHLAQQGVPLVVLAIPAKARIYEEKLAEQKPVPTMAGLYNRLFDQLMADGVPAPDLEPTLDAASKKGTQVFLRTDTHWSPMGADLYAKEAASAIKTLFAGQPWDEQTFVTTREKPIDHRGDLLNYIPLAPLFTEVGPDPDVFSPRTTDAASEAQTDSQSLFGDTTASVVLVGTSYSANPLWDFPGALRKHLGRDLINVADEGQGPIVPMVAYLQSPDFRDHPPELVIWEFPERYLAQPLASEQAAAWFRQTGTLLATRPGATPEINP